MWCITLVDLCVLKNPCIPGIRSDQIRSVWDISHLIMAYDPFNVFWIQFASILLRIFVSCSAMILVYNFLFCDIFVWFWYQGDGDLTEWVWELFCLCSCSGTFSEVKGSGCELWMTPGFMASGGEDFDPQAVIRLDHSELLCSKVLLRYKRDRENFWHRHQKGTERVPPCELFYSV